MVARLVRRRDTGVSIAASGRGGTFSLFADGSSEAIEDDVRGRLLSGVVSGVIRDDDGADLREATDGERDRAGLLPRTDDV